MAAMPEELPPGFEFGGYKIVGCIGRGGMARVYQAEHAALHKAVALKVLDTWVVEKPGGRERFLREARTAAAIKHPSVVDIVDVGVLGERPYIVMELLDGCDLDTELERRGALTDNEVISVALPVIAGLIAVHDAGIVHRDIKPSNIFLAKGADGEITPKVLDFGISKFSDTLLEPIQGLTNTREIVGTPTYMPPEALNGARDLGPLADQYALGAVLYDCAVGRPPFEGETLLELLKAIALGSITPPRSIRPEMSVALEAAILRAMSPDPNARFETLRDLGSALWPLGDERTQSIWSRAFGKGTSPRTSRHMGEPATSTQIPRRSSWARRRWLQLSAAAVLCLGAGLVWYWWSEARTGSGQPVATVLPRATEPAVAIEQRSLLGTAPGAAVAPEPSLQVGAAEKAGEPAAEASSSSAGEQASSAAAAGAAAPGARKKSARDLVSPVVIVGKKRPRRTPASPDRANPLRGGGSDEDSDLEQLFQSARTQPRPPATPDSDGELRAVFPSSAGPPPLTANGAPLPD